MPEWLVKTPPNQIYPKRRICTPPLFPPRTAEPLTFFRCPSQWEQYAHGMPLDAIAAQKYGRSGSEAVYRRKVEAKIKLWTNNNYSL